MRVRMLQLPLLDSHLHSGVPLPALVLWRVLNTSRSPLVVATHSILRLDASNRRDVTFPVCAEKTHVPLSHRFAASGTHRNTNIGLEATLRKIEEANHMLHGIGNHATSIRQRGDVVLLLQLLMSWPGCRHRQD